MKALAEILRSRPGAAAGLATIFACASPQMPPPDPSQPPTQTEQPKQQTSKGTEQGQASSEANEPAQQTSDSASDSASGREAGEPEQSESGASDETQEAGSKSDKASGSDESAAETTSPEDAAAAAEQTGSGTNNPESEGQQQAEASGSSPERDGQGSAGRESEPGDPSEAEGSAVGGIPVDEVPPELLEAFGRGGSGTQTERLNGEEVARALERLAEHQGQVDELIQQEQMTAASESGDIGVDSTGLGAKSPPLIDDREGQRADVFGEETPSSAATASTDTATGAGSAYRPPSDVGDGRDDDTLAAQLRELAMRETDPALRERYWEEYRKHKGIQ